MSENILLPQSVALYALVVIAKLNNLNLFQEQDMNKAMQILITIIN